MAQIAYWLLECLCVTAICLHALTAASPLSAYSAASHGLSLLFPLSLFIIFHPCCLSVTACPLTLVFPFCLLCPCSIYLICPLSSFYVITCHILVSFLSFPFLPPAALSLFSSLFLFSLTYFPHRFKLLVQFSSRAVVGLKAAQWHWVPVLARQAAGVASSPRPPLPRGLGWPTRLPIPPLCTLCPARPLWVPAGWAVACRSTMPSGTAAPVTSPAPSLVSALSPSWARAMTRPWVACTAASGTSWMSSRMRRHWRPAPMPVVHLGPHCLAWWGPCFLLHSRILGCPMDTTSALGAAPAQALASGHPGITRRQRRTNGASMALNQPF